MYKTLNNKIIDLQNKIKTMNRYNDPQIVIVSKQENKTYKIIELYYNPIKRQNKRKEIIVNDYKKIIENYSNNNTRVIINDLI